MRVLGIDPGTGRLGWAIIEKENGTLRLIAADCVNTPVHTPLPDRLFAIYKALLDVIQKYKPQEASIEELFFAKNQTTAMSVAAARGVVILACRLNELLIQNYTPSQIKNTIAGHGKADKKQVAYMVSQTLKTKDLPKLDDTIDAIAAALTHLFRLNARMRL